jgi:hypothetical protein
MLRAEHLQPDNASGSDAGEFGAVAGRDRRREIHSFPA